MARQGDSAEWGSAITVERTSVSSQSKNSAISSRQRLMSDSFTPYARQVIDDDDVAAVVDVLRGDWLTTGPCVERFEYAFAKFVDTNHAVAVSSGTAALHLCMQAAGIGPGDEVIVPALTF